MGAQVVVTSPTWDDAPQSLQRKLHPKRGSHAGEMLLLALPYCKYYSFIHWEPRKSFLWILLFSTSFNNSSILWGNHGWGNVSGKRELCGTLGTEWIGPEKKSQRSKRKGERRERVKSVSCVKSGDLQRRAQLKLCIGCCASRS